MKNFYISDLHFGHSNILRYDNRPFYSVKEMDECLIENWNSVVSDADRVYILGDVSWYKDDKTAEILRMLKGEKHLIRGNHDRRTKAFEEGFQKVKDVDTFFDGEAGYTVVLNHYPILFWDGQYKNNVHLYGHVHNSHQWNCCESFRKELAELQNLPMRMINVGCMMPWMGYTPRTLKDILEGYLKWLIDSNLQKGNIYSKHE